MSKSHSFSVYLLKQDFNALNVLEDDHELNEEKEAKNLPDDTSSIIS